MSNPKNPLRFYPKSSTEWNMDLSYTRSEDYTKQNYFKNPKTHQNKMLVQFGKKTCKKMMCFSSIYTHPHTAAPSLCLFLPFFGISKNATKLIEKNKRKHIWDWPYLSNKNSFEVLPESFNRVNDLFCQKNLPTLVFLWWICVLWVYLILKGCLISNFINTR